MDILTAVCVFDNCARRTDRRTGIARARGRELFLLCVIPPIYPAFTYWKLIDNELWLDGNFVLRQA